MQVCWGGLAAPSSAWEGKRSLSSVRCTTWTAGGMWHSRCQILCGAGLKQPCAAELATRLAAGCGGRCCMARCKVMKNAITAAALHSSGFAAGMVRLHGASTCSTWWGTVCARHVRCRQLAAPTPMLTRQASQAEHGGGASSAGRRRRPMTIMTNLSGLSGKVLLTEQNGISLPAPGLHSKL